MESVLAKHVEGFFHHRSYIRRAFYGERRVDFVRIVGFFQNPAAFHRPSGKKSALAEQRPRRMAVVGRERRIEIRDDASVTCGKAGEFGFEEFGIRRTGN